MIEIRHVDYTYGGPKILKNINAVIEEGEVLGIIGPSGAGKTTLLRILLGQLTPTAGSIHIGSGQHLAVGYVPQIDAGERTFPITVEETVMLGATAMSAPRPWFDRGEKRRARSILERLGIGDVAEARLSELSGGQFQRVLIGRALMSQPNLLILDEPTSGIDLRTRSQVLELIEDLRRDGYSVVLTTHDLNWVAAHLPRIICLNREVIADGAPLDVLTREVVNATYNANMDVLIHNGRPVIVDSAGEGPK